jgi:hypothetical protein
MKTTLEIADELLLRAKKLAKRSGRPLRAVVEEGLRLALEQVERDKTFKLRDFSVGNSQDEDPLEALTWQDLRDEIYGKPERR